MLLPHKVTASGKIMLTTRKSTVRRPIAQLLAPRHLSMHSSRTGLSLVCENDRAGLDIWVQAVFGQAGIEMGAERFAYRSVIEPEGREFAVNVGAAGASDLQKSTGRPGDTEEKKRTRRVCVWEPLTLPSL